MKKLISASFENEQSGFLALSVLTRQREEFNLRFNDFALFIRRNGGELTLNKSNSKAKVVQNEALWEQLQDILQQGPENRPSLLAASGLLEENLMRCRKALEQSATVVFVVADADRAEAVEGCLRGLGNQVLSASIAPWWDGEQLKSPQRIPTGARAGNNRNKTQSEGARNDRLH